MVYTFHFKGAELKFTGNLGWALVIAPDPESAVVRLQELFRPIRDVKIRVRGEHLYRLRFKVALNFRPALLRSVQRAVRLLRNQQLYERGRYIDRYIIASIFRETGTPGWLQCENLVEEIRALRRAAVVAREVSNIMRFVDWDIAIHNHIEINSKPGHRSRVVRRVKAANGIRTTRQSLLTVR
ncbi:MAG: hypothetical protein AB1644_10640 [Candidatus Zixiibacteriota bacterium]